MKNLIIIIAGVLCILLAACVGNTEVKSTPNRLERNAVDTVALIDRINELNASFADMSSACDTAALPKEFSELIFPEAKVQNTEGKFTAVMNQLMSGNFSLDGLSEIFTSDEEQEVLEDKDFKSFLSEAVKGESDDVSADDVLADIIMEKYVHSITTKANNMRDLMYISNKYIELISSCDELKEESKDLMYIVIEIGVSAAEFWMTKV